MLLTEQTINNVRDASIMQVIGQYVKLDRNGKAHCPFHSEKSGSFKVTESKSIFKCFGCGESGDAIGFIMKHEKVDFIKAIETIAQIAGIPIDYEEVPDKEKYEAVKALKDQMKDVLNFSITQYKNNLWDLPTGHPVELYLADRDITKEDIAEWQLGWATEEWRHITPLLINKNAYVPAEKLGLIKRSKDGESNYDGFRSRITFPITNAHGEYVGLAGRYFELDPADKGKDFAKYINPPENELYSKSHVLFGLSQSAKAIKEKGFAFLVEGYLDVITMHKHHMDNTVGTCGTALTIQQAILLKKHTTTVVILRDGDSAGQKAAQKDLPILLKAGFKVEVGVLPEKEDPDSFVRNLLSSQGEVNLSAALTFQDGVLWQVAAIVNQAGTDDFKIGMAKQSVLHFLAKINNDLIRSQYLDNIIKKYKWNRADMVKQMAAILEETNEEDISPEETNLSKLPKWMDKEQFLKDGFCQVKNKGRTGYYSFGASGQTEISNFVINPLFHIYASRESRHLIQIDNGHTQAILDVESKAMVSIDVMQQIVVSEGAFIIYGSKAHWLRIANSLLRQFPKCEEVSPLGWQDAGFFAYVDKIFIPGKGMLELSEWGIIDHKGDNYLVPAASAAYKAIKRKSDDPYESDRVLTYAEPVVTFQEWGKLMQRVYFEKGVVAIAYIFLTAFRDVIFNIDNNCPHLYGFGEKSAGKSKWAESIAAFFYKNRAAYNLNSGTDFAFFAYMKRFVNCVAVLNEFDEKVIRPDWFQNIKGVFDGEGRQRGVMGSKNRVEVTKVQSTLILIGQFLHTGDDNSMVSRSIVEGFNERDVSEEDKEQYNKLKLYEQNSLNGLLPEVLKFRDEFKSQYKDRFNEILGKWRKSLGGESQQFNQRIMQNWCHLYTGYLIMSKYLQLPDKIEAFEKYCKEKALYWSGFIRSSDTLSEFWNTFSFLVDQGTLEEGWDFKIENRLEVKIRNSNKEEHVVEFGEQTKVIYIRMNNVHKHYQHAYRMRTGKEGMTLENLLHYFSSRKYYVGSSKQSRFKRFVTRTENVVRYQGQVPINSHEQKKELEERITSSLVFLYNHLGIEIERAESEDPVGTSSSPDKPENKPLGGNTPPAQEGVQEDLPF